MMPHAILALLLAAACRGGEVAPTPYDYVPEPVADEAPAPEVALAAIEEALAALAGVDPEVFSQRYLDAEAHFDPGGCPSWSDHNDQDRWIDDCVTTSGLEFHGDFIAYNERGFNFEGETVNAFLRNFGQLNVTFPSGERLLILGDTEVWDAQAPDGHRRREAFAYGDFLDDAGPDWLTGFPFMTMSWSSSSEVDGSWSVGLAGELGRLRGEARSLELTDVQLSGDPLGCEAPPTGTLRAWVGERAHEVSLRLEGGGAGGCVACGPFDVAGVSAGEACVDLSAWRGAAW